MKKNDSGITLIALVMTIIVLIIIVSISSYEGSRMIATSKVQTLETNMLTIQAKAKGYAEEIDAKIYTESQKDTARNKKFIEKGFSGPITLNKEFLDQVELKIRNSYVAYSTKGNSENEGKVLTDMGLSEIKDEEYIVVYSLTDYRIMDVVYPAGINYEDETFYTLSSLQSALKGQE